MARARADVAVDTRALPRAAAEATGSASETGGAPLAGRCSYDGQARVVELRGAERHGQDQLAAALGLSPRTVARVLGRHPDPYLHQCDPITGEVIRASEVTAVRYARRRPGELVYGEAKVLGRIHDGGGWRNCRRWDGG